MWATQTFNNDNSFLTMQSDGNLVLYSFRFRPLWQTNTNKTIDQININVNSYYLFIEDTGNLVINDLNNATIWSTNTTQIS